MKVWLTFGEKSEKSYSLRMDLSNCLPLGKGDRAIRGAITTDWGNGQTEGQVNRLKLIKREMYGRASSSGCEELAPLFSHYKHPPF